jgi:tetratricopeptide (TPR) repeat protein
LSGNTAVHIPDNFLQQFELGYDKQITVKLTDVKCLRRKCKMQKKFVAMLTEKFSQGDYTGVLKDLNKAIELDPTNAQYIFMRGNVKDNLKNYAEAILDFDKMLELEPNFAPAYTSRARVKMHLGDYQAAEADCVKAEELLDPENALRQIQLHEVKAGLKFYARDYSGAIEDNTTIIRLDPNNAMAYRNRAAAAMTNANVFALVANAPVTYDILNILPDINQALELNPAVPGGYALRGNLQYDLENLEEALNDAVQSIAVEPANIDGYCLWAKTCARLQSSQPTTTDSSIRRCINAVLDFIEQGYYSHESELARIYSDLGEAEYCLKNYQAALQFCNTAIEIHQSENVINPDAYKRRADIKFALGDKQGALADLSVIENIRQ